MQTHWLINMNTGVKQYNGLCCCANIGANSNTAVCILWPENNNSTNHWSEEMHYQLIYMFTWSCFLYWPVGLVAGLRRAKNNFLLQYAALIHYISFFWSVDQICDLWTQLSNWNEWCLCFCCRLLLVRADLWMLARCLDLPKWIPFLTQHEYFRISAILTWLLHLFLPQCVLWLWHLSNQGEILRESA